LYLEVKWFPKKVLSMKVIACVLASGICVSSAAASELLYTPVNPTFGGSPLNSTQLMAEASAQKPSAPAVSAASKAQSTTQQFVQMLQSQLYASLANSVSNAITGQNAQATGTIKLNSMQLSWNTAAGETTITMTDFTTGQITEITVPQFTH
jgi:curli production assembly/transport component CsgF